MLSHEREVELFLHFGINAFVGVEWGSGKTSPQLFLPTNLDCCQWVVCHSLAVLASLRLERSGREESVKVEVTTGR
jgi:hypothetical protein